MFSFFLNDRAPSENGQSGLCPGLQHRRSAGVLARETGAALPAAIQPRDVAPPGARTVDELVLDVLDKKLDKKHAEKSFGNKMQRALTSTMFFQAINHPSYTAMYVIHQ